MKKEKLVDRIVEYCNDGQVVETLVYSSYTVQWQHLAGHQSVVVYDTRDGE